MFQEPSAVHPAFSIVTVAIAMLTASMLARLFGQAPARGRFASLDGLRGFLALGVFMHHSVIWYFYLASGRWAVPPSHLYTHFGQSSVALFFMITSFLFTSKLLGGRDKRIDWLQIYVSRVLRLFPLYLFAVAAMFFVVFTINGFEFREPVFSLIGKALRWSTFTVAGTPDLIGMDTTWIIVAGVTWSLPYEWLFYVALPLGGLVVGLAPDRRLLIASLLGCILICLAGTLKLLTLAIFGGGIAAAFCVRSARICALLSGSAGSLLALGLLGTVVIVFPEVYSPPAILLLSAAFIIIACGNTLFGVLVLPSSRLIGDMGYSVYLLHGIFLFITFRFIGSSDLPPATAPVTHWLIIFSLVIPLLLACYATYRMIELPAMKAVPRCRVWLRSTFPALFNSQAVEAATPT